MSEPAREDEQREVLLGVVDPDQQKLPGMPEEPDDDERDYDTAVGSLRRAHAAVKERIAELVRARAAVNEEVKLLREEDDRLSRMLKIAEA